MVLPTDKEALPSARKTTEHSEANNDHCRSENRLPRRQPPLGCLFARLIGRCGMYICTAADPISSESGLGAGEHERRREPRRACEEVPKSVRRGFSGSRASGRGNDQQVKILRKVAVPHCTEATVRPLLTKTCRRCWGPEQVALATKDDSS